MSKKITFIGAGSLVFTRILLTDILSVKELQNFRIAFTDINEENLQRVTQLCQRDIDANGLNIRIEASVDRKEALTDADYVVNCVRVGGLEAYSLDIDIPLQYGVDQCVGDTLGAGGIMYGQRTIAAVLDFCKDIRKYAKPNAILLNYSNPNAMVTWACNHYGGVYTIGLCHGEIHGEMQIADVLGIPREELDITCVGINHQTWYASVKHKGVELRDRLLAGFEAHPVYSKTEKVRIDLLKRFGYYATESNGHFSEYVAWYRKRPEELMDWIDLSDWINGETGGYLRNCREERKFFNERYSKLMAEPAKKYDGSERGNEHGSYIIEALETGRRYRGHFNVVNRNAITNLPADCIVEVPCYVDGNGISVPQYGDLDSACAAVCSQSIWVQRLSVEAAVSGNVERLKQAMLMDPLNGAVLNPPEVWQMTDEMLLAQRQWLPQYADKMAEVEKRLEKLDPALKKRGYAGAAVQREKGVEEIEKERAARVITV